MPGRENTSTRRWLRLRMLWTPVLALVVVASAVTLALEAPIALDLLAWTFGGAAAAVLVVVFLAFVLRRLLWRVGRRLAFSYVLLGLLPFLLSLVLVVVSAYLLSGFFLGHLYRDAAISLYEEIDATTEFFLEPLELDLVPLAALPASVSRDVALSYYRGGVRVAGDDRAPEVFPEWLVPDESSDLRRESTLPPLVALPDGSATLASAEARGESGVVAFHDPVAGGALERELSQESGVWIRLRRQGETEGADTTVLVFGTEFVLQPLARTHGGEEREEFFAAQDASSLFSIVGVELAGPLNSFADGTPVSAPVSVSLAATRPIVFRHLFSSSAQVDTLGWVAFVVPAFLLFDVFVAATLMAMFLILGLSRAVNRLSAATEALQDGDFGVRIPVRRRDQIGALQTSFNEMAESLEGLVAERTAKHALEQELEIAREVQKSLIPGRSLQSESVEFSTFFEPSAAIGGDYFDIVRLPGESGAGSDRLAVVIADVAGHGLSAGLRMAMLKAGLLTLVDEGKPPRQILSSLDRLVRSWGDRAFVTASLSLIDLSAGVVEMTNAGHPPAYLLRRGEVREIMLPGTPLGALGQDYAFRHLELEPGDVIVWLSDGFIEAVDGAGEPFGYERTLDSLSGSADSAKAVCDRILAAMRRHAGDLGVEDDLSLVVMRYRPEAASSGSTAMDEPDELLRATGG